MRKCEHALSPLSSLSFVTRPRAGRSLTPGSAMLLAILAAVAVVALAQDECGPKCEERFEKMSALRDSHGSVIKGTPAIYNVPCTHRHTLALIKLIGPVAHCSSQLLRHASFERRRLASQLRTVPVSGQI